MKTCTKCKQEKGLTEFHKNHNCPGGLNKWCKSCRRMSAKAWREANREEWQRRCREDRKRHPDRYKAHHRKMAYGLTPAQYQALLERQANSCALCGAADRPLHVDHCHTTNRIRGLLCRQCNTGIGQLAESPVLLSKAITYITQVEILR